MARWWRRDAATAASTTPAAGTSGPASAGSTAPPPVQRGGWRDLPPLRPVVAPTAMIAPLDTFTSSLATAQNPSFLAPLGHLVVPAGPAGHIDGMATPTVSRTYASSAELPVAARKPQPTGVVQRLLGQWISSSGRPASQPEVTSQQTPADQYPGLTPPVGPPDAESDGELSDARPADSAPAVEVPSHIVRPLPISAAPATGGPLTSAPDPGPMSSFPVVARAADPTAHAAERRPAPSSDPEPTAPLVSGLSTQPAAIRVPPPPTGVQAPAPPTGVQVPTPDVVRASARPAEPVGPGSSTSQAPLLGAGELPNRGSEGQLPEPEPAAPTGGRGLRSIEDLPVTGGPPDDLAGVQRQIDAAAAVFTGAAQHATPAGSATSPAVAPSSAPESPTLGGSAPFPVFDDPALLRRSDTGSAAPSLELTVAPTPSRRSRPLGLGAPLGATVPLGIGSPQPPGASIGPVGSVQQLAGLTGDGQRRPVQTGRGPFGPLSDQGDEAPRLLARVALPAPASLPGPARVPSPAGLPGYQEPPAPTVLESIATPMAFDSIADSPDDDSAGPVIAPLLGRIDEDIAGHGDLASGPHLPTTLSTTLPIAHGNELAEQRPARGVDHAVQRAMDVDAPRFPSRPTLGLGAPIQSPRPDGDGSSSADRVTVQQMSLQRMFEPAAAAIASGAAVSDGAGSVVFRQPGRTGPTVVARSGSNDPIQSVQRFGLPGLPKMPSLPSVPSMPNLPTMPSMPKMPNMPGVPAVPGLPDTSSLLSGAGRTLGGYADSAKSAAGGLADSAGGYLSSARGAAEGVADSAQSAVGGAVDSATSAAGGAVGDLRTAAGSAMDSASGAAGNAVSGAQGAITGAAGAAAGAAGAAADALPTNLDELARRMFDQLSSRFKSELWLDRERAGMVTDLRR